MNGNQMMGRRTGVPEKSKRGIKGVLKELFTYSSKLRLPMIIAFVFSMIGAVLTIIGPNQLSRITDLISDGLMTGIDLTAVAKVGGVLLAIADRLRFAGFAIRPEKLKVSRNAPTDATVNAAQGEIWDIGYLGDMTVFYVKLDSGKVVKASMLNAQREVENPIAYDEKVWVSFGETAGVVLKD